MQGVKVLIADDEEDVLNIMCKKVAEEGYAVVQARDGQEAWEKIVGESPDVIVLDLTMPKKDGLDVLKDLRKNPPSSKWQPVIIVSARSELEDIQKGYSLEADHYISKPCKIHDLIKAIKLMVSLIPQRKTTKDSPSDQNKDKQ